MLLLFGEKMNTPLTEQDFKPYARGSYNKYDDKEQWIRLSEGCPNNCEFCRETKECGTQPIYLEIPQIVRNQVKIMDMNLVYKPECLKIIDFLGGQKVNNKVVHYELICGIDYRYMLQEKANALHNARFHNIRFAWDHELTEQMRIKDCLNMLKKAGYINKEISCFMICNWKIPYTDCLIKLDLCKIWGIKVNDSWFDNQLSPNIKPIYWTVEQIKDFRHRCRKHNQMVLFGIDPELKQRKSSPPNEE